MKRCPQCGREYDNTMSFCLDDGAELLYGPATSEPATAILRTADAVGDAPTRAHIHTTLGTDVLPSSEDDAAKVKSFDKQFLAVPLLLAIIVLGGFFGYRYLSSPNSGPISSIAVLPFENVGGTADSEYLSDGLAESLIYRLSQVPELKVSPRSSVFRYKGKGIDVEQVGSELGVDAVLSGRMIQRGDNLNISVDLVDIRNKKTLWGEQMERKMSDLLATQREIASAITQRLQFKLSGDEVTGITKRYTDSNEAFQAYLKGRYFWNRRTAENLRKAIEQFKVATDRDPNYALAFAGLADCYALLNEYSGVPQSEAIPQAKNYAERAIALDAGLAEPHATLGTVNRQLWQYVEAEKEFKRAIEINPNYATAYHWYAIMLLGLGRKDEALATIQRAHELDPLSSIISATVTWVQLTRGNYQESIENAQKLIELDPNFGIAHDNLGMAYLKTARNVDALASFEKAAQLTDRWGPVLGNLGYSYAVIGKQAEALAVIKELEEKYARNEANGLSVATVYAGLRDTDKVFEWLEKDYENRDASLADITASVPLEPLRGDPRFKDLLRRMGSPE